MFAARSGSVATLGVALLCAAVAAVAATGAAASAPSPPPPGEFVPRVDNPWFPLRPGTVAVYHGVKDGERSRDVVAITHRTKLIQGVRCTVVRDRLYLRGELEERTQDWYAQDRDGNVWYFGEATAELFPNGQVKTREGSWQSGLRGARAGIFMPARPRPGQSGRQELFAGHAEDHFRILSLDATVRTPAATSVHALLTREWTPLEPGVVDHKLYVRGVGTVLEETVRGGLERNVLVAFKAPSRKH